MQEEESGQRPTGHLPRTLKGLHRLQGWIGGRDCLGIRTGGRTGRPPPALHPEGLWQSRRPCSHSLITTRVRGGAGLGRSLLAGVPRPDSGARSAPSRNLVVVSGWTACWLLRLAERAIVSIVVPRAARNTRFDIAPFPVCWPLHGTMNDHAVRLRDSGSESPQDLADEARVALFPCTRAGVERP